MSRYSHELYINGIYICYSVVAADRYELFFASYCCFPNREHLGPFPCAHSWSICLMHIKSFQMIYYFLMFGCGNNLIPFDFLLIFFFYDFPSMSCGENKIQFRGKPKPNNVKKKECGEQRAASVQMKRTRGANATKCCWSNA